MAVDVDKILFINFPQSCFIHRAFKLAYSLKATELSSVCKSLSADPVLWCLWGNINIHVKVVHKRLHSAKPKYKIGWSELPHYLNMSLKQPLL